MRQIVKRSPMGGAVASGGIQTFDNQQTAVGAIVTINNPIRPMDYLRPFNVSLAGAASASTNFLLGDPGGMIALINGGSYGTITSNSIGSGANAATAFNTIVGLRPLWCAEFVYVVSSATQYANTTKMLQAGLDGQLQAYPINIQAARRSSDYQTTILNIRTQVIFAPGYGFFITVGAGLTATLTFMPTAEWNPGVMV